MYNNDNPGSQQPPYPQHPQYPQQPPYPQPPQQEYLQPDFQPTEALPPVSAPPTQTLLAPMPEPAPAGEPPAKRSTSTVVLASLLVLMFIAAGVMTGLYVVERGDHGRTQDKLKAESADLAAAEKRVKSLSADLKDARAEYDDLETRNDNLTENAAIIVDCLELTQKFMVAIVEKDGPKAQAIYQQMYGTSSSSCSVAEKLLK